MGESHAYRQAAAGRLVEYVILCNPPFATKVGMLINTISAYFPSCPLVVPCSLLFSPVSSDAKVGDLQGDQGNIELIRKSRLSHRPPASAETSSQPYSHFRRCWDLLGRIQPLASTAAALRILSPRPLFPAPPLTTHKAPEFRRVSPSQPARHPERHKTIPNHHLPPPC